MKKGQGYFIVDEFCTVCMWYMVFTQIISLALAWTVFCFVVNLVFEEKCD